MKQVKIFHCSSPSYLEITINEWLENNQNINILDIKWHPSCASIAMIIYEDK